MIDKNIPLFQFPDAKQIVVCGDIHGDFNLLVHKMCVTYDMHETLLIVAATVGGVTDKNKNIVMNDTHDTKMNRIHEIFHTFGFSHPKGSGGEQEIMRYPPSKPSKLDALELSTTLFLPTIIKQYFGNLILNYFNRFDSLITPHPFGQATLVRSPHFGA